MNRRAFIEVIAGGLTRAAVVLLVLAAWLPAWAQQPRVARIGVITSGSPTTSAASVDAFRQRLRELGYAEGRNVTIEVRADAQPERFHELATELVGLGVDVIVASGTAATRAAKELTSTIPIVMVSVGDAVGAGFVKSLRQPGGNITGQSFLGPDIGLKGLDLLMEILPRAKRVVALYNPEAASSVGFGAQRAAAQSKGVTLQRVELRRPEDLDPALAAMGQTQPNGLLVFAVRADQQVRIVKIAAKNRLPAVYSFREAVDAGGLMSFGPRLPDLWRGAANYVDKILKGAKPGDLPVEQPTTFELVVNLKTAKVLGLTIPQSVLARADEVIQ
jgi:putative ABC transport system substrate-binding protein